MSQRAGLESAFIDLASYSLLDQYMYSTGENTKIVPYNYYKQKVCCGGMDFFKQNIKILKWLLIIYLFYIVSINV
jgi:hypothetical protein